MKKVILGLTALGIAAYACIRLYAVDKEGSDMSKNVALIIASQGFQEQEYHATRSALEHAGYHVITASDRSGIATGHAGNQVETSIALVDLYPSQYAGVFMIGGPGTLDCLDNTESYRILNEAFAIQKPHGAICLAPRVLAHAQVLRNKRATGWDGDGLLQGVFDENHVMYVHEPVVTDGLTITAEDPHAADAFGAAIVSLLQGK